MLTSVYIRMLISVVAGVEVADCQSNIGIVIKAALPGTVACQGKFSILSVCFLGLALLGTSSSAAFSQNSFENLDFEAGTVTSTSNDHDQDDLVNVGTALPGWSVFYGNTAQAFIQTTQPSADIASVSLVTKGTTSLAPAGLFSGRRCVLLQEGFYYAADPGDPRSWATASISQCAMVPCSALSLTFNATPSALQVTFDGNPLALTVTSSGAGFDTYACDISPYAGEVGRLCFSNGQDSTYLDNILFSSLAVPSEVPEPATVALMGLAGLIIWLRCRG